MSNILPNSLIKKLGTNPFFDQEAFKAAHESGEKLTSIRLNPQKPTTLDFELTKPVQWCNLGFYLKERPKFTLDPLFHAGCYYVQEASSMFIAHILRLLKLDQNEIKALDLCAAPGGKSTLLNATINSDSLLVANEIIKSRSVVLQENLMRWGYPNVVVTNNDPTAFRRLPGFFNLVLVDAPCSGSGMFRKDEDSIDEWSEANVKLCSERQQRILSQVMGAIATNGYLLYSTCSYSSEENEDILEWLIDEYELESIKIPLETDWGIEETLSKSHKAAGYRFYPHKTKGEGFFIAVLKMKRIQPSFSLKKIKLEKSPIPKDGLKGWVETDQEFSTLLHNENVHIFPKDMEASVKALQQVLYLKNAGTMVGKWLGKELVPSHDLALSIYKDKNLASVELSLEDAQNFLRKEQLDIALFEGVKKGWCLVNYKNVSLGWVKVLGNRINNYYPREVRIANM
ncbi:methyltransferase RsmF C-terminal domain-like protein [Sphingobacterium cellulitidis]|uniref:rRNA cytosine-C5-methyltransferase n=1 Tax=Sphingobacterium cellulitidis TaxID=1768011 RepID=A0A8H9G4I9_9SPHI|nr:RNA methyltransferase [Sphingobacterium soli]MBA8988626.1 16S rRNA C967 or C1407 C5-methylase (RsmB/RsmF family)/NOL1/NOP2/fmu family ribosome biogenesis protein [Sphingobacterium soli]GGE34361.1 rRNA cytosine-C5-methyltransferase [Sphingobacterium soli]